MLFWSADGTVLPPESPGSKTPDRVTQGVTGKGGKEGHTIGPGETHLSSHPIARQKLVV